VSTGSDNLYHDNTHEIEPKVEEGFPLMNAIGKFAYLFPEVRSDSNFPQGMLLKMAGREQISIHIKNHGPAEVEWNMPGVLCMNAVPKKVWVESGNEMTRRCVVLHFSRLPVHANNCLREDLDKELARIILKVNRIYLCWSKFVAERHIYSNIQSECAFHPTKYWRKTSSMFIQLLSPYRAFWAWMQSDSLIAIERGATTQKKEIEELYKTFLVTQSGGSFCVVRINDHHQIVGLLNTLPNISVKWDSAHVNYTVTGFRVNRME
jgi:hypothetical protein